MPFLHLIVAIAHTIERWTWPSRACIQNKKTKKKKQKTNAFIEWLVKERNTRTEKSYDTRNANNDRAKIHVANNGERNNTTNQPEICNYDYSTLFTFIIAIERRSSIPYIWMYFVFISFSPCFLCHFVVYDKLCTQTKPPTKRQTYSLYYYYGIYLWVDKRVDVIFTLMLRSFASFFLCLSVNQTDKSSLTVTC